MSGVGNKYSGVRTPSPCRRGRGKVALGVGWEMGSGQRACADIVMEHSMGHTEAEAYQGLVWTVVTSDEAAVK